MGGVHACMTAALYPRDVALAALLAPRSAAVAYCDGALSAAMAWEPLLREVGCVFDRVVTPERSQILILMAPFRLPCLAWEPRLREVGCVTECMANVCMGVTWAFT
jgi:hypothetical protein